MDEPITAQMEKLLREYSNDIQDVLEDTEKEVAKETVKRLKAASPVNKENYKGAKPGTYRRGWRVSVDIDEVVVHNTTGWQLTHILNNGHAVVNRYGDTGSRVAGDNHISNEARWAETEFPDRVVQALERKIK